MNANWPKPGTKFRTFLDLAVPAAQECERKTGVPTCVTLAQAIEESGEGQHHCGSGNNYFGIIADCRWKGPKIGLPTMECENGKWVKRVRYFRAYPDMAASFVDHSNFLVVNKLYADLFKLDRADYKGWANGLKRHGYATNPKYAANLIRITELLGLQYLNLAKDA